MLCRGGKKSGFTIGPTGLTYTGFALIFCESSFHQLHFVQQQVLEAQVSFVLWLRFRNMYM